MFTPLLALSVFGSALAIGCGAVLWAFGGRIVHRAVAVAGFVGGIPAGVMLGQLLDLEFMPAWACAIIGAFAGLLLALLAYRLALAVTVSMVAVLVAGIVCAAVIDRGWIASDQARAVASTRAGGFTEALGAVWAPGDSDAATLKDQTMEAYTRFWSTLDPPERTLFAASTLAAGVAGLCLGFFMRHLAEMAATATAGSLLIAWGLSQMWGAGSPPLSTWAMATAVLSFVGFIVQCCSTGKQRGGGGGASAERTPSKGNANSEGSAR